LSKQGHNSPPLTYKDAGVDIDAGDALVEHIKPLARSTDRRGVMGGLGGFGGLFDLKAAGFKDPILVSGTDGVGTKLKVATLIDKHDTVGIDLVAMSVNDALCCGAEPLFFLDYIAMSHDDPERLEQLVKGVSDGCIEADCALMGGETAIMPDIYARGEYDLAGFCVGVVERKHLIDGKSITPGDMVLGIAASGLHSNGFSLIRKVVFDLAGLGVHDNVPELGGQTVGEALLTPTRIYTRPIRKILQYYKVKNVIHGIAHITGGGLRDNLERILPENTQAILNKGSWPVPPVFSWLQKLGGIEDDEMERVFNMGIGLSLVFNPHYETTITSMLNDAGLVHWKLGEIHAGPRSVVWAQ
jgi:phosphoribosylformylglycinamidine cyclo-ligase